jgi:hypothetical protein
MRLLFSLGLAFLSMQLNAQINDSPVGLAHYVFGSFTEGTVMMRSGEQSTQQLNYNLVTKEMIFEQAGTYLAIAHPEQVDTIVIQERRFVPVNHAFYEYLGGSTYPFFIEHTCTIREEGASTGFGNTNTTAATSIKSLQTDGGAYKLKLPDQFKIIPGHTFYIFKDGKYSKVGNEQQLEKIFPEKRQFIKDWVKKNHTGFSKQAEILPLIMELQ